MPLADSPDLQLFRTADGSFTLRSEHFKEGYHSRHGAVQESTHVFMQEGLAHVLERIGTERPIDVLEVGLGTGLNLLLTWIRCLEGKCQVNYSAIEPFLLERSILEQLGYAQELAWPGLEEPFLEFMTDPSPEWKAQEGGLNFRCLREPLEQLEFTEEFDLVYFDAFAPHVQPEMWTVEVFRVMYRSMRKSSVLVTYCAKGDVRRSMQEAGFSVERLQGPPGKREMLRATK
jgi:tRNA U34 5-methylaminomethyl-2-thiouridine-forming methyltransferase MnmC